MALSPKMIADGAVWAFNSSSAVGIIFINKILMSNSGYGFRFAVSLCACHYLLCSCCFWVTSRMGYGKKAEFPLTDLILFVATANLSIVSLNLSLLLNKVGIYQISKLLNIPFVALVEKFYLGRTFSPQIVSSMACVVVGVAIVTVSDTDIGGNVLGVSIAMVAVASSGMQQIFCRSMQQKHNLASHELLANVAPAQGWSLLAVGPFLDYYVVGAWLMDYQWSRGAVVVFGASCTLAVAVNISQFMCLGRFSAISYQVLGHVKTVMVLFGGWALLGETITQRQLFGMAVAVSGMILYGYFVTKESEQPPQDKEKDRDSESGSPLLRNPDRKAMQDLGLTDIMPSDDDRAALLSKASKA